MSTEKDGRTLTRKQLRELRLTGSTPVISDEEAATAAQPAPAQPPADAPADPTANAPTDVAASADTASSDATPSESDGEPSADTPAPGAPLTRRAARAQERIRTGSVPVVSTDEEPVVAEPVIEAPVVEAPVVESPVVEAPVVEAPVVETPVVESPVVESPGSEKPGSEKPGTEQAGLVSGIPAFGSEPAETPLFDPPVEHDPANAMEHAPSGETRYEEAAGDAPAESAQPERPMVGAAFGIGVRKSSSGHGVPSAFDELLDTGSGGSHKTASTLIFTPSPGAGSLSGPVASTGELLITGTYSLPEGMGSQGHALGTTDGKDIDAVLVDGELAPASSPTPIAASSAISTSKPAGEVIRPPVPDKGSKLTLTLAIVAGGLALALAAALIIAFTTGVLG